MRRTVSLASISATLGSHAFAEAQACIALPAQARIPYPRWRVSPNHSLPLALLRRDCVCVR
jgi:hypothetical protein